MNFFEGFPWSNKQSLNLDWLLDTMKNLLRQFAEFKAVNTLTYGGIWDITKNYPAWTIVTTGNSGYISLQPVPVGVPLTDRNYWIEAVELDPRIAGIIAEIAEIQQKITELKNADAALDIAIKNNVSVYDDLDTMLASEYGYTTCICASVKGLGVPSVWERIVKTEDFTPDIFSREGQHFNFVMIVPTGEFNVAALGVKEECSADIAKLIEKGVKRLYFPAGSYRLHINASGIDGFQIRGDGRTTRFFPDYSETKMIIVSGKNIVLRDFYAQSDEPENRCTAIQAEGELFQYSQITDVLCENFTTAFFSTQGCSTIWNRLENFHAFGCFSVGIRIETGSTGFFNLNTFVACQSTYCVDEGLRVEAEPLHCIGNVFIGCNFEYNGQDRFEQTSNVKRQINLKGDMFSFNSCYFENNVAENMAFLNGDAAFIACQFIGVGVTIPNVVQNVGSGKVAFTNCWKKDITALTDVPGQLIETGTLN